MRRRRGLWFAGDLVRKLTGASFNSTVAGVIRSFADKRTAAIFAGLVVHGLSSGLQQRARNKLLAIDAAAALGDLRVPPGNRLEALRGDRKGQHSIRVNRRWRICFAWHDGDAGDVEIVDYH